jgi:hypothetical protein
MHAVSASPDVDEAGLDARAHLVRELLEENDFLLRAVLACALEVHRP